MNNNKAVKVLREACQAALDSHNLMLMSFPPKDAWVSRNVDGQLRRALAATACVADGGERAHFDLRSSKIKRYVCKPGVGMEEDELGGWIGFYQLEVELSKAERAATQPARNLPADFAVPDGYVLMARGMADMLAAPISEASAPDAVDVVALLDEQKSDVKARNGDWWRGYEAALHWIGKAIKEKQSEVPNEN
jgi:hypothetical protein